MNKIEFTDLEKEASRTGQSVLNCLAPDIGRVYVVSITRDGCPACEKQKPKMDELARTITEKHKDKVVFTRVHIGYSQENARESLRSKDVLGHYFYPTNLILLRTGDRGAFEYYRNVSSEMDELKGNINNALETATALKKEMG